MGRARASADVADRTRAQDALSQALDLVPADHRTRTLMAGVKHDLHDFAAARAGRSAEACALLREALDLSPAFDPLQAPLARAELSRLAD